MFDTTLKQLTQPTYSIIIPNIQTGETNMATLDVRNTTDDEITHIQFGSFHNGCSGIMTLSGNTDEIAIYDKEEKNGCYIRIDDIDNLILALQKAKELWGGK